MAKTRTHCLTDDPTKNVSNMASYRLNMALDAIRVFGNCCGSNYKWTEEQIEKADKALLDAMDRAIGNIKDGKAITETGIRL